MIIEGAEDVFDVTPHRGINEASFLIRVKDPTKIDFENVKGKKRYICYMHIVFSLKKHLFNWSVEYISKSK